MKRLRLSALPLVWFLLNSSPALANPFDSGSTGADGPLNVTNNTTLILPPNGVFNFTTINVESGATLRFSGNALNTPVYLLATSNVTITGNIDVSGYAGGLNVSGQGGPGGFDGGNPASGGFPPGDGYGPGGGKGGTGQNGATNSATAGAYATTTIYSSSNRYGNIFIQPLVGGSGGGGGSGQFGGGGGGGGGAILIAANTQIHVSGTIYATAGTGENVNYGSGGAIRLIAPIVFGNGALNAGGIEGGDGRIRIDTLDRTQMAMTFAGRSSVGAIMSVFPSPIPRLDVIEVAGQAIPFGTNSTVVITLPVNSPTNQTVKVQGMDFSGSVSLEVAITPENGISQRFSGVIDMGTTNRAIAQVSVIIPADIPCRVDAWTR